MNAGVLVRVAGVLSFFIPPAREQPRSISGSQGADNEDKETQCEHYSYAAGIA
jgi:hypothetical protein